VQRRATNLIAQRGGKRSHTASRSPFPAKELPPSLTPNTCSRQILNSRPWGTLSFAPRQSLHSITTTHSSVSLGTQGLKRTLTATIPSPHSLAAILSPSAPPEETASSTSRASTPKRTHAEAFSAELAYLHPTSPTQHQASIASVSAPSPGSRIPDDGSGGSTRSLEEKKPQKMVRSSIACVKCRRSKVKCEFKEENGSLDGHWQNRAIFAYQRGCRIPYCDRRGQS
jgi:hypothetical protein